MASLGCVGRHNLIHTVMNHMPQEDHANGFSSILTKVTISSQDFVECTFVGCLSRT